MAEYSRVTSEGWEHGDDSSSYSRISSFGWEHSEAAGGAVDLVVQDSTHAHSADNLALTQQNQLAVADAAHGHAADNVVLSTALTLSIADALHAHSVDNITLVQQHVLVVADAAHGHSADNVVLSSGTNLAVADATHGHSVDNLILTQQHVLVVADSRHVHTADNVTLVDPAAQDQQQTLGGRGSRGLLDMPTDGLSTEDHIRAVNELHEARLKQQSREEMPAPIAGALGQGQPKQIEQPKPKKKRKSVTLPADVIAGGLEGKQPAKVDSRPAEIVRLPAKVEQISQVEATDAVNDDEFAIVLAQFLLAA